MNKNSLAIKLDSAIKSLEKIIEKHPSDDLISQVKKFIDVYQKLINFHFDESTKEYKNALTEMTDAAKKTKAAINDLTKLEKAIEKIATAIGMVAKLQPLVRMTGTQRESKQKSLSNSTSEAITQISKTTHKEQMSAMEQNLQLLKKKKELVEQQLVRKEAESKNTLSELEQMKKALSDLKLPEGKKGEITIAAGGENTALLRSKRPLLALLDDVANELTQNICPEGTVLLTEDQLKKAYEAKFKSNLIDDQITYLTETIEKIQKEEIPTTKFISTAGVAIFTEIAGASLNLAKSISELFRVDREFELFQNKNEADKILRYLLDSKNNHEKVVTNPEVNKDKIVEEAEKLWKKLEKLTYKLHTVKKSLDQIKNLSNTDGDMVDAHITQIESLLEELHLFKHSDNFWKHVEGEVLAATISEKSLLLMEVEAQTLQVKESRWWWSERILAIGEVQVLYRLLNSDRTLNKSGIILKSSKPDNMHLNKLEALNWSRP